MLLSDQKGMRTPDVWSIVVIFTLVNPAVSQIAIWRSLILLNPVVAMLSRSPSHTTRAPYTAMVNDVYGHRTTGTKRTLIPPCPSVVRTASALALGSNRRILRSLHVVTRRLPDGLNARLWIASPCPLRTDFADSGLARSHSLTTWSPVVDASTLFAVGWNSTCPTRRGDTSMRATGSKSMGSQCSWPQPSNAASSTFQIITLPSSPADATTESLNGDQSVSSTGAEWLRARGMRSGSLEGKPRGRGSNGEGSGRIAKAPPPEAFQLMLM